MSDVEENNFEGRVSTKPREPSSAAARCSGFHGDERGRAGLRGVLRGPAGSSLWSHHGCFLTYQDGFWVPLFPQTPRITPSPPFFGDWLIPGLLGPISPRSGALPSPHPWGFLISVPRSGSPSRWGGRRRQGVPLRPDSGRCFLRWHFWRPRAS